MMRRAGRRRDGGGAAEANGRRRPARGEGPGKARRATRADGPPGAGIGAGAGALLEAPLADGLRRLGLAGNRDLRQKLIAYLELLLFWNRSYNLVGDRDPRRILSRHVFDSLAFLPHVRGPSCLDLGSGAGFPGLPLALALPRTRWVLLDSRLKCARFLRQAVLELRLEHVAVVRERAERYRPAAGFVTVVCRALTRLDRCYRLAAPLCAAQGRLLTAKGGGAAQNELRQLAALGVSFRLHPLRNPARAQPATLVEIPAAAPGASLPPNHSPLEGESARRGRSPKSRRWGA